MRRTSSSRLCSPIPTVQYPIHLMCLWLAVSRSGFYDWRGRPQSATARRRNELKKLIATEFADSDEASGYRRVHAALARRGVVVGKELVRFLMRELGLQPCQPRPWRHNLTDSDPDAAPIPDLVQRDFTAEAPGQKMVGVVCGVLDDFSVVPPDPEMKLSLLSAGNQQKALIGKLLETSPQVAILHEPTQGVDIGARHQIFQRLRATAGEGLAIAIVSNEYEDLSHLCHRVLVFRNGAVVAELTGTELTAGRLIEASFRTSDASE